MTSSPSTPQIADGASQITEGANQLVQSTQQITEVIPQTAEGASQSLKFCSSCSREKRLEGGTWIPTSNKKQRWICASCLYNRTHRTGSTKV